MEAREEKDTCGVLCERFIAQSRKNDDKEAPEAFQTRMAELLNDLRTEIKKGGATLEAEFEAVLEAEFEAALKTVLSGASPTLPEEYAKVMTCAVRKLSKWFYGEVTPNYTQPPPLQGHTPVMSDFPYVVKSADMESIHGDQRGWQQIGVTVKEALEELERRISQLDQRRMCAAFVMQHHMPKIVGDVQACEAVLHCSVDTQWSKCIVQIASSPKHIHGPEPVCNVLLKRLWGVAEIFEWVADCLQGVPPARSAIATLALDELMERFNTAIEGIDDKKASDHAKLSDVGTLAVLCTHKDVCYWAVSCKAAALCSLLKKKELSDMMHGYVVVALACIVSQVSKLESKAHVVKLLRDHHDLLEQMAGWGCTDKEEITQHAINLKCVSLHAKLLVEVLSAR